MRYLFAMVVAATIYFVWEFLAEVEARGRRSTSDSEGDRVRHNGHQRAADGQRAFTGIGWGTR